MLRLSSLESRNWKEEMRPMTLSPGNCESAEIRSSEIPSEKYACFLSPLMFTNGRTATECAGGANTTLLVSIGPLVGGACAAGAARGRSRPGFKKNHHRPAASTSSAIRVNPYRKPLRHLAISPASEAADGAR